ncbi:hypothetical protein Hamer_G024087 [Homarus americanus]|uniref:Uncharacterized protein n=1 Tax=Homarus americanus TaxID=6706 RepID=A0A8J5MZX3_HOMAM|nr:hypothetical protein Hamer_G024087 [Homarus americanus]
MIVNTSSKHLPAQHFPDEQHLTPDDGSNIKELVLELFKAWCGGKGSEIQGELRLPVKAANTTNAREKSLNFITCELTQELLPGPVLRVTSHSR